MAVHLTRVQSRLSIHAHRKVRGLLEGEYAALHAGRSMDFNDLREYVRGDDVKDIDWKASARSRALLVKRYAALRQHTIQLVVSTGRSMAGLQARDVPKRDLAVLVAGVLGWLAVRHGDLVGVAWGDAEDQHLLRPQRGELPLERGLQAIHDATTTASGASDLAALVEYVVRTVRRRTVLALVCDAWELDAPALAAVKRLAVQHEVLFVTVGGIDPTSEELALDTLTDVETGRPLPQWVADDEELRRQYAEMLAADAVSLKRQLDGLGIVHTHVADEAGAIKAVFDLLEHHRHARRR
ncbi:hypothetical protein GCM10011584_12300 [Nocardioides phosphati]|uniref:DUF58 domain-containing protein n=1 Tax=Nocardioides phosphati TaxID=1867775 RepID=A0ABQ2N9E0_9ACTN|nr:DUF58 domain-containing protein [Nocardioides phosphati]GGO87506.1 hypothetical protein GCM10011584_12300 [Nocardioides phosphati]